MSFSVVNDSLSNSDVRQLTSPSLINLIKIDPVTKSADFTVSPSFDTYVLNVVDTNVSVTLPNASLFPGRVLHFKRINSGTGIVVSASSNVFQASGSVGTNIISAVTTGNSATLLSNGTYWYNIRNTTVA
jgi:hypothetical protein